MFRGCKRSIVVHLDGSVTPSSLVFMNVLVVTSLFLYFVSINVLFQHAITCSRYCFTVSRTCVIIYTSILRHTQCVKHLISFRQHAHACAVTCTDYTIYIYASKYSYTLQRKLHVRVNCKCRLRTHHKTNALEPDPVHMCVIEFSIETALGTCALYPCRSSSSTHALELDTVHELKCAEM